MFIRQLLAAVAAVVVVTATTPDAFSDDDGSEDAARLNAPLARIDGKALTVYYFERVVTGLQDFERARLATESGREEFLMELVDTELKAQEAIRRGYDKHEEVQEALKDSMARAMETVIRRDAYPRDPTEDDLRRYYDKHPGKFNTPEKVRAEHIVVKDRDTARRLLESVLKARPSPSQFGRLSGDAPSGSFKSLDLGFIARPDDVGAGNPRKAKTVAEAAFAIERDGEIYPELVRSEHGYHIVMRTGYKPAGHVSYSEAKAKGLDNMVRLELLQKNVNEKVEALKQRFPVLVHDDVLKEIEF